MSIPMGGGHMRCPADSAMKTVTMPTVTPAITPSSPFSIGVHQIFSEEPNSSRVEAGLSSQIFRNNFQPKAYHPLLVVFISPEKSTPPGKKI